MSCQKLWVKSPFRFWLVLESLACVQCVLELCACVAHMKAFFSDAVVRVELQNQGISGGVDLLWSLRNEQTDRRDGVQCKRRSRGTRVTFLKPHPRSAISPQPRRLDVGAVVQLHIIVTAVRLLLDLKHLEDDLHSVTLLSGDHPQTVRAAGVVVISELSMRVQIFGFDLGFKAASTFWEFVATKLEGSKRATRKK